MNASKRTTGRKARGPQVAEGNKLEVEDIFLPPSLLMKLVLPKMNLFFFFFPENLV